MKGTGKLTGNQDSSIWNVSGKIIIHFTITPILKRFEGIQPSGLVNLPPDQSSPCEHSPGQPRNDRIE